MLKNRKSPSTPARSSADGSTGALIRYDSNSARTASADTGSFACARKSHSASLGAPPATSDRAMDPTVSASTLTKAAGMFRDSNDEQKGRRRKELDRCHDRQRMHVRLNCRKGSNNRIID